MIEFLSKVIGLSVIIWVIYLGLYFIGKLGYWLIINNYLLAVGVMATVLLATLVVLISDYV